MTSRARPPARFASVPVLASQWAPIMRRWLASFDRVCPACLAATSAAECVLLHRGLSCPGRAT